VAQATYSPDGKHIAFNSKNGMEIMNLESLTRTVIVPQNKLSDHEFHSGGIGWSRRQHLLALPLFNRRSSQYELWTVSTDGTNFQRILTMSDGSTIEHLSFVQN
ncbi:MAG: hypothetical protein L0Z53_01915, partial [Acidobacteriales bacterium]|nr:hypothetical protein [Terriglobales bacterium]